MVSSIKRFRLLVMTSMREFAPLQVILAQQCIEKYLKAWLQEANIPFARTHDLERLLNLILPTLPDWGDWQADFSTISEHAVDFRYPGKEATATDAQHAIETCIRVRQAVREQLELSTV